MEGRYLGRVDFLEVFDTGNEAICDLRSFEKVTPDYFAEAAKQHVWGFERLRCGASSNP
ncbi:DNA-binding response regulator [Sesbania bispinosa]|nr:DNA-binding response regulator [Sesbania bispinosa]